MKTDTIFFSVVLLTLDVDELNGLLRQESVLGIALCTEISVDPLEDEFSRTLCVLFTDCVMAKRGRLFPGRGDQSEAVSVDESKNDSVELDESLSLSKK